METPYVCTLDEATQKKAKEELNEIPSDRITAVQALRDWAQQQPHLTLPDLNDSEYLMFLRGTKFSQLRAREMIDGNMQMRNSAPEWFVNIDTCDPKIQAVINDGYAVMLPKRTKDGCQIMLYRLGCLDANLKRYSQVDVVRTLMCVGACMSRSELTQINGTVFIMDFTGFTTKHLTNQMNASDMKKFHKLWQKNVPGRFKKFHYYNAGIFLDAMMALMKPFLEKKFADRTKTHDSLVSLYKHIPMELLPDEYLPDDYTGPSAGPVDKIIENMKNQLQLEDFRSHFLERTNIKWGVDESKRPKKDQDMQQSFRKLNVD